MKRFAAAALGLALGLSAAGPARAATNMLTSAGVTTAVSSSCPSDAGSGCASGKFRIAGAARVTVHVWETTGAGTGTVTLWGRLDATDEPYTLKTWTNPATDQIPVDVNGAGEVWLVVTAPGAGARFKGKLAASTPSGARVW